jgi:hypothetical protein
MEKKVEVEVNGKKIKVAEHLLSDMAKFGATQVKRVIVNTPKELIKVPQPAKEVLPEMKLTETPKTEPKTRKPRTK